MKISLENLSKTFDSHLAIDHVSLDIRSGEMFFLLGSSGCGKTTLLKMLAGFHTPDTGKILFGEKDITSTPPHKRNSSLVFQNYALWPHMTIFQNVAYGLKIRKLKPSLIKEKVLTSLKQVHLDHLADRKPNALSGGQQQRVALARAIITEPDILLFDEPLSNLDAKLRIEMRSEIKRLHQLHPITTLYVTHDQEEALSMADRVAIMNNGKIEQIDTPQQIYNFPKTPFVANFLGKMNIFEKGSWITSRLTPRSNNRIGFRPERVRFTPPPSPATATSSIPVTVTSSTYLGSHNQLTLTTPHKETIIASTPDFHPENTTLHITIDPEHILIFPENTATPNPTAKPDQKQTP